MFDTEFNATDLIEERNHCAENNDFWSEEGTSRQMNNESPMKRERNDQRLDLTRSLKYKVRTDWRSSFIRA